jgi:hypothetical protein
VVKLRGICRYPLFNEFFIWKIRQLLITLYFKVLFMDENLRAGSLQDVQDIKRMMQRSSRFTSLSAWSFVGAGAVALISAAIGRYIFFVPYYRSYNTRGTFIASDFAELKTQLIGLAFATLLVAGGVAALFTWFKARRQGQSLWEYSSRQAAWQFAVPMVAGAVFLLGMLQYDEWRFVAPGCLLFYGLSMVAASRFTLGAVRWLGFGMILLGLINLFYIGYGMYFWTIGFGALHIVFGLLVWLRYERKVKPTVAVAKDPV